MISDIPRESRGNVWPTHLCIGVVGYPLSDAGISQSGFGETVLRLCLAEKGSKSAIFMTFAEYESCVRGRVQDHIYCPKKRILL